MLKKLLLASAVLLPVAANAADIKLEERPGGRTNIYVSGKIEPDDLAKFRTVLESATKNSVGVDIALDSGGGNTAAGLEMAKLIKANPAIRTVVQSECHSACAIMWLAGARRFVYENAEVGFHGSYNAVTKEPASIGNALVGAFLQSLGYSDEAIKCMVKAPWNDFVLANECGIKAIIVAKQTDKGKS
jgi:hypothetical protein